jgi:hypothetical protein
MKRLQAETAAELDASLPAVLDRERIYIPCQLSKTPGKTRLRHADADVGSLPMNSVQKQGKFLSVSGLVSGFRNSLASQKG